MSHANDVSRGRAPHGARGLKSCRPLQARGGGQSRPARGAWIEITHYAVIKKAMLSRPARGAWIEIFLTAYPANQARSRPARGAWIEIPMKMPDAGLILSRPARGAWIEMLCNHYILQIQRSRPARGAWIEIFACSVPFTSPPCRAPHGARGLKYSSNCIGSVITKSRPARGAWIEIMRREPCSLYCLVAPRTGRVD